ncbi:MAG: pyruvate ferredoxin oxidoreductase [Elusimicrobia bacterium]|nr:pyruvate ferredoxin oxidoreductase [Elusimicrobiota bacterium]
MKKLLMGNHTVSWGAMLARAQVIAAYPITPQTQIVEELATLCAEGKAKAQFIKVESEHSALASCIGASAAGARAFTATSSQGLALMHELLHWAAGARLPIVMANVNRAMAPGWNIWTEQTDSLAQRDTGWIQFYCENNQEILDSIIQAYKISETVSLPSMIVLDAFFLSHTTEPVEIPPQELVDKFLPPYKPQYKLDPKEPHAFGGLSSTEYYYELRYKIQKAMERAKEVIEETDEKFNQIFERKYGLIEEIETSDAEVILVTSSTITSTARFVTEQLRKTGKKIGLLKVRVFRPFPSSEIRDALSNCEKVAVIDRNISFGSGGIFASEIKSAIQKMGKQPVIFPFIAGLGGRDITVPQIEEMINYTFENAKPKEEILWRGLKYENI